MKHMKKWLALGLSVAMVLCLLCANLTVVTAKSKTWGDFEPQYMTSYSAYGNSFGEWSATAETGLSGAYLLVSSQFMRAHTNGYSAIRRFDSDISGTFYLEQYQTNSMLFVTGGSIGDSVKFGIFNENKELVWPTNGDWYTVVKGEDYNETIEVPVTAGGSLYFVATDPSAATLSLNLYGIGHIGSAPMSVSGYYGKQVHSSGYLCASNMSQQGVAGTHDVGKWYYMYAKSVTLTNADPDGDSNMGGGEYTVDYGNTLTAMHKITSTANGGSDPNSGWLGNGSYNKTPFVAGMALYFGSGNDAQITRFTPSSDGNFQIGYAGIQLRNSWPEGTGVDFCIVDHTGKVVYPETGGVIELRAGTDNPFDKAGAAAFYYSNLKAGEYLDFVFIPRGENLEASYDKYVYLAGSFKHPSATLSGNRIDSSGRLFLSHGENQGDRQITMFTASDVSVNKVAEGEWKEFVQLGSGLKTAPATAEVQVKIPENVPDWQVGTIISDMNGTTGNGFAVMMDTFGHPRFISGGVDWTVKSVDLRNGAWTRLTFTADTAAGKAYCYINGAQVAETELNASLAVSGNAPVIGNDLSFGFTTAFEGSMKKLTLANTARSAAQVENEMTVAESTHYWALNGVYTDKAGSNHGVLTQVNSDWYENGKPADAAEGEYTIVHVGDNQVVTDFINDGYQEITKWIAANAERLNIQMVINTGDLVNYAATTGQWDDAVEGMNILMENGIPYVYATGNHEYPSSGTNVPRTSAEFNKYFDIADHMVQGAGKSNETKLIYAYPNTNKLTGVESLTPKAEGSASYGKNYEETIENGVYFATLGGKPYAFIALEAQPRKVVIEWANTVLTALEAEYDNLVTYVNTHIYLESDGKIPTSNSAFDAAERLLDYTPAEVYNLFLSQHKSIQVVLSGHVATGIATRTDVGVNGNKIVSIMNDQSYEGNGGEGNVLLLRCREDGTVIKAEYYSTILERYYMQAYQFDFDTADPQEPDQYWLDFDAVQMGEYAASYNGTKTWYSYANAPLDNLQQPAMMYAEKGGRAAIRTFVAPKAGEFKAESIWGATGVTIGKKAGATVKFAITDDNGKVLWPTDGKPATLGASSVTAITLTGVQVAKGDKIHFIAYSPTAENLSVSLKSVIRVGTAQYHDGGYLVPANGFGTQGDVWYYNYAESVAELSYNPNNPAEGVKTSYTVSYSAGEGGTLGASTSGTWAADKCVVNEGGTVRFTAKPQAGYRIVGYYVNGAYYKATRRILTLPMIKEDLNVVVKFAKNKIEGDANGDGVVDILDLVNMNNGVDNESAFGDKTVCDLVDEIAAASGVDKIDANDVKELRKRILG